MRDCPHATLVTHGPDVGLPRGQMGNSEVGHTNIGAGRVVAMDLGAIDLAIEDGSFGRNGPLLAFIDRLKAWAGPRICWASSRMACSRSYRPRAGPRPARWRRQACRW